MNGRSVPDCWDVEADVVVVGFGAAGMATAVTAHDLGAKIVILGECLAFGRVSGRNAAAEAPWE